MHHKETVDFYNADAAAYVARRANAYQDQIGAFIKRVGAKSDVLELGCGGGHDAELMIASGVNVTPTDGSAELCRLAEARLGRPVRVMRFDELDAQEVFDGVWANRSLLHVPSDALPGVLRRIWRALKPGGLFFASYKSGNGGELDVAGRYYNFPSEAELASKYEAAAPWAQFSIESRDGGDHDDVVRKWLLCNAVK
jgi:SAM-dependent methyltransferase